MKFSIIVPCYNEEENISRCLTSLLSQDYAQKEIIVVDDASTDRTSEIVSRFCGNEITLVSIKTHKSKVRALNEALKVTSGDVIAVLDGDSIADSSWLSVFKEDFTDKNVVAVGGGVKGKDEEGLVLSSSVLLDIIHHKLLGKFLLPCKLSGSNFAVRKKALLEVGGFDERKWPGEDLDIYMKLERFGKVVFNPSNAVSTAYPKRLREAWRRKFWWGYGCGLLVREKPLLKPSIWLRPLYFTTLFLCLLLLFLPVPDSIKQYSWAMFIGLTGFVFLFYTILSLIASFVEWRLVYLIILPFLSFFFLWRELGYFCGFLAGITRLYK